MHKNKYLLFTCKISIFLQLGNTLVFLMYLVAKNPRVQNKLHEEVDRIISEKGSISMETLQEAEYLQACIMEAFR